MSLIKKYPMGVIVDVENGQSHPCKTKHEHLTVARRKQCSVCRKGQLHRHDEHKEVVLDEHIYLVPMVYDACEHESCGIILFTPEQSKYNQEVDAELEQLLRYKKHKKTA